MYCANCGAKNEDGAKFCLKCGHSLKEEPTPTPNPPFPNPPKPPKPHGNGKAILKLIGTISVELVVLVLLIFGAYKILDNRFSPKTIATDYWKATADCEWSEAYDYCDFPESTFLTKELYVAANADNTEPIHYKSLTIKSSNQMDYEDYNEYLYNLKDQDQKTYYVQYRKRGADNTTGEYITLTKTGKKKYLFWNEWKVVPTNSWVENLSYTIPVDASLFLNDKVIDDSSATTDDGQKTITIPYLFTGKYQLQVTEDGMKPYSEYVDVSYSTYGESINLLPSEETLAALGEQAGTDIKFLLESALQGKSFKEVQDVFASTVMDNSTVKNDYQDVVDRIQNKDLKLTGLDVSDFNATLDGQPYNNEISMIVTTTWNEYYINYWDEADNDLDTNRQFYVTYRKEDGQWKLTNLPIYSYHFV